MNQKSHPHKISPCWYHCVNMNRWMLKNSSMGLRTYPKIQSNYHISIFYHSHKEINYLQITIQSSILQPNIVLASDETELTILQN